MLINIKITEEIAANFLSKFEKYGDIRDFVRGEDLANAIILVGKDIITAETLYSIVSKKKDITLEDLAVVYDKLSEFGYELNLDHYVETRPEYMERNPFKMLFEAVDGEYMRSTEHKIVEYISYYIDNIDGRGIDDKLSVAALARLKCSIEKDRVSLQEKIYSFQSVAFYNKQGLLNRNKINMIGDDDEGIYLVIIGEIETEYPIPPRCIRHNI